MRGNKKYNTYMSLFITKHRADYFIFLYVPACEEAFSYVIESSRSNPNAYINTFIRWGIHQKPRKASLLKINCPFFLFKAPGRGCTCQFGIMTFVKDHADDKRFETFGFPALVRVDVFCGTSDLEEYRLSFREYINPN